MNKKMQAVEHLLDSARGIYIPRDFYQLYCKDIESVFDGLNTVSMAELDNPENEFYWDTWNDELEFLQFDGEISYERHTMFENGVNQVCLTKGLPQG